MKTADFDYNLPPEAIAQTAAEPRHSSRLLVLNRADSSIRHVTFWDLDEFLNPGDLLVINQTRVIPARIYASKVTGGRVELLLLNRRDTTTWEALVGGKGVLPGRQLNIAGGLEAEVLEDLGGSRRLIRFSAPIEGSLDEIGQMPLPPYIHTPLHDPQRYQTVFAKTPGSAAAPTAGLHFTAELIEKLQRKGIRFATVTLHIGLDTFAPVNEADPSEHHIHTEWCQVDQETVDLVQQTRQAGGRIIAVGTTSVRALESAAQQQEPGAPLKAFSAATSLFILPGYSFRVTDALITNFHLPKSSLIMLVSAFAGRERILNTYQEALQHGYRFYSFGDAMLIV